MGWLDKYETGGNLQKLNPNNEKVSFPPNFQGHGTLNKGFNYNSAWGGRWKNGGELTKLNQLTNFTNYNKPQSGGWLSKYE